MDIMKSFLLICIMFTWTVYYVDCRRGGRSRSGRGGGGSIFKSIYGTVKKSPGTYSYPLSSGSSSSVFRTPHSYPPSNGLSGSGFKYGQRYGAFKYTVPRVPSYYTVPQYVYAKQYRNSGSRYNDLLTGLTVYNMGRSHSIRHYYYRDSFYRGSGSNLSSSSNTGHLGSSSSDVGKEFGFQKAACLMKIVENEKEEVLKIPCAIVTTFAAGQRVIPDAISDTITTVCVNASMMNSTFKISAEKDDYTSNYETFDMNSPEDKMICKSTIKTTDPLSVTGAPINPNGMLCLVEIWREDEVLSNEVDCKTLLHYAKMPVPENTDALIMPTRSQLKEMLENPP